MKTIYLDNAATSFPKPEGVSRAMKTYIDQVGATINRSQYGSVQDAKAVGEICAKHGIAFVLDAAQTAGHYPVDFGLSALCVPGHKGLPGPSGIGALLFRLSAKLDPLAARIFCHRSDALGAGDGGF